MEKYLTQLLDDIAYATENVSWPFIRKESYDIREVPTPVEEERYAPLRELEEWTGVRKEQLPPPERLTDDQITRLLEALQKMLHAYNWSLVRRTVRLWTLILRSVHRKIWSKLLRWASRKALVLHAKPRRIPGGKKIMARMPGPFCLNMMY